MAGMFERLREGLTKTRDELWVGLDNIFGDYSEVDDDFFEDLLEQLIMADMGVPTAEKILSDLRKRIHEKHVKDPEGCRTLLREAVAAQMKPADDAYRFENERSVVLVTGVNGVGKTTSIGKLAYQLRSRGKHVILCAADTFRAAAAEQLSVWADRAGVPIVKQHEGADPASVVYDGIAAFRSRNADLLICDTAGRLHNKKNLMEELGKIKRIIRRELPDIHLETLLVLDATTGQNALLQAREFLDATDAAGIILTKMDGTAKGGIAVAVNAELSVPVKYIGVGEKIEDLQRFDPDRFVDALFEKDESNERL